MTAVDERRTDSYIVPEVPASTLRPVPDRGGQDRGPNASAVARRQRLPATAVEAELRILRITRWAAAMITALIAVASFVLSFSSLWDLASRSVSWPHGLAWLWPLIVDGAIVVATLAIRALAERTPQPTGLTSSAPPEVTESGQHRGHRRFFWSMLVVSALVSVGGNGLHATLPAGQLPSWLSVLIGCIPAGALLATTHALQRLSSLDARPTVPVDPAEISGPQAAELTQQRGRKWYAVAAGIHERGLLTNQSTDTLAGALPYLFDVKPTPSLRAIAAQIGVAHHDTVGRIRDAALLVLNETAGDSPS
jgi:hypothetical protein